MPLSEEEYLLQCLAEECAEVAQRVSKAIRFTPAEVQPGQHLTNAERIKEELVDLRGVVELLVDFGTIRDPNDDLQGIDRKKEKVAKFLEYSRSIGVLSAFPTAPKQEET